MKENLPRLDLAGALDAMGDDREMYREILDTYLSTIPGLLNALHAALAQGDLPTVIRHAHSLKSSSRSVGAQKLGTEAEYLELSAPSLPSTGIEEKANLLRKEFGLFCRELANEGFEVPTPF